MPTAICSELRVPVDPGDSVLSSNSVPLRERGLRHRSLLFRVRGLGAEIRRALYSMPMAICMEPPAITARITVALFLSCGPALPVGLRASSTHSPAATMARAQTEL